MSTTMKGNTMTFKSAEILKLIKPIDNSTRLRELTQQIVDQRDKLNLALDKLIQQVEKQNEELDNGKSS
jgi:hypothetical protein